ncbi:MAG: NAD-dependent deacylase [Gemmatimonadota bacterium]|nr:NAD-dependent deacylase [Gemmatimonadota bacterium]
MTPTEALAHARALVAEARRIVVLTGAGISAESGVPTFRGEDGLWKEFRAEDLATPQAFRRDPRLVWEWYGMRRETMAACRPNPAHRALAALALAREGVTLVTQNVDGLHAVAAEAEAGDGDPSPALPLELHGSLFRLRCTRCNRKRMDRAPIDATALDTLPKCTACGGLLRPDVVWFGEMLDPRVLQEAFAAASAADLCLVVGTSALVHPAASVPLATLDAGGDVVEINPTDTPLTEVARVVLRGRAGEILPALT